MSLEIKQAITARILIELVLMSEGNKPVNTESLKTQTIKELRSFKNWKDNYPDPLSGLSSPAEKGVAEGRVVSKTLLSFFRFMAKKSLNILAKKKRYIELQQVSDAVMLKPSFHDRFCKGFTGNCYDPTTSESTVVDVVAGILSDESFLDDWALSNINAKPIVGAIISDRILRVGVSEFCNRT